MTLATTFKNLGHKIASIAQKFVSIVHSTDAIVAKAVADKNTVDLFSSLAGPQAQKIVNTGYSLMGVFAQAIDAGDKTVEDILAKHAPSDVAADIKSTIASLLTAAKSV